MINDLKIIVIMIIFIFEFKIVIKITYHLYIKKENGGILAMFINMNVIVILG